MKPIVFDLYCGLFGWGESFAKAGFKVIGFDIENQFANFGKQMPANCELILRDVRSLSGAALVQEYGFPVVIVASPPCQEFSYMAMPWSKAKEKRRKILADPAEQKRLTDLFNQCFRIQREISEAAGHYVPIIIENVRGAQEWVGRSRWNFGSYHLWGDVPALMPIPMQRPIKQQGSMTPGKQCWCREGIAPLTTGHGIRDGLKLPGNNSPRRWEDRPVARLCDALRGEGNKTAGMNWSDQTKRGQDFTRIAGRQATDGIKDFRDFHDSPIAALGSKSSKRKEASALIAKIPPGLAMWIAKVFKPESNDDQTAPTPNRAACYPWRSAQ